MKLDCMKSFIRSSEGTRLAAWRASGGVFFIAACQMFAAIVLACIFISGFTAQCAYAQSQLTAPNIKAGAVLKDGACMGAVIPAKGNGNLKFAVLADVHISVGAPSVEGTAACVDDINKNSDIQFVVIDGDIANFGSDDELAIAKNIFDKLEKPWFIVAGNHDAKWSESGTNSFLKTFGYERFEFEAGGMKFLGTQCGPNVRMAPALIPMESMNWLKNEIAKVPENQPLVFVNHYPLDSSLLKFDNVLDLLKTKNIQFVINGHWHTDNAMDYRGVPGAIVRSSLAAKDGIGYVIVNVEGATVTFADKIVGKAHAKKPWFTLRMSNGRPYGCGSAAIINDASAAATASTSVSSIVATMSTSDSSSAATASNSGAYIDYSKTENTMNKEYPQVKTLWRVENKADIGCAAAICRPGGKSVFPIEGSNALPSVEGSVKSGDVVIFADEAGFIYGLNALNGNRLWSFKTEGKIFSSPSVSLNIAVVGSTDNYIYALNALNGKLIWKYKCGKSVLGTANIYKDVVYIGASDGHFRALNLKNGKVVWDYGEVEGFIEARPYVDDKQVVIGDWANSLYSFDTKNGNLQWKWMTKNKNNKMLSPAAVWPIKAAGKIVFVTPERFNYELNAEKGTFIVKNYGGRESIGLSPDGASYYVKCMKDTVKAYSSSGLFMALPQMQMSRTGAMLEWQAVTDFGYEIAPTPITSKKKGGKNGKGILFVPTDKGNIYALNCADGSVVWKHNVSGALINYILPIGDSQLLVSTMDGIITLLKY